MKNRIFIASNFVLLFLFVSCNQKIEIQYYDTGEIRKTTKRINEHESEIRFYFKNGQIEQEGIMYDDSLKDGQWKAYYSDGVLMRDITYSKNKFIKEDISYPIILDFKHNPSDFETGNTYQFRVLGAYLYSMDVPRRLGSKTLPRDDNGFLYMYEITPKFAGDYTIMVITKVRGNSDSLVVNKDTIFFPIKVVENIF